MRRLYPRTLREQCGAKVVSAPLSWVAFRFVVSGIECKCASLRESGPLSSSSESSVRSTCLYSNRWCGTIQASRAPPPPIVPHLAPRQADILYMRIFGLQAAFPHPPVQLAPPSLRFQRPVDRTSFTISAISIAIAASAADCFTRASTSPAMIEWPSESRVVHDGRRCAGTPLATDASVAIVLPTP